jgi:uncharacterized protein YneF (UPF0154 family)
MKYKNYLLMLLEYADKVVTQLMRRYKTEHPELTEPQMRHYIEAFDRYKSDARIKEKDITKYSFDELEHVIDSNFLVRGSNQNIEMKPIFEDDELVVYEGNDRNECVLIGSGESWCVSRPDASNMYNSYRYRMDEPHFYFIKNKRLSESDMWSFFVLMPFKNGSLGLASRANTHPFSGSEQYTWEEVLSHVPFVRRLQSMFKSKPLTTEERRIAKLVKKKLTVPDLIQHFKKLSLVEHYIGWGHKLTVEQFSNLENKELRMKYINMGHQLSTDQIESLTPPEVKRFIVVQQQAYKIKYKKDGFQLDFREWPSNFPTNLSFVAGDLNLGRLKSLPPGIKFPESISGDLDLDSLTSLPPGFRFPESLGGRLSLYSLKSLPPGVKLPESLGGGLNLGGLRSLPPGFVFPESIGGYLNLPGLESLPPGIKFPKSLDGDLNLYRLESLPPEVWNSMSNQVKSKIPDRLKPENQR